MTDNMKSTGHKKTRLSDEQVTAMLKAYREWQQPAPGLRETVESMLVNVFWAAIDAGDKDARY